MMSLWLFSLMKMHLEMIKDSNHHLIKFKKLYYTAISSKPYNGLGVVSSLQNRAKDELEMFGIIDTNI